MVYKKSPLEQLSTHNQKYDNYKSFIQSLRWEDRHEKLLKRHLNKNPRFNFPEIHGYYFNRWD